MSSCRFGWESAGHFGSSARTIVANSYKCQVDRSNRESGNESHFVHSPVEKNRWNKDGFEEKDEPYSCNYQGAVNDSQRVRHIGIDPVRIGFAQECLRESIDSQSEDYRLSGDIDS